MNREPIVFIDQGRAWVRDSAGWYELKDAKMFASTCQRRSPILNFVLVAFMAASLVLLCSALMRNAHGAEPDLQRAAMVHVTGSTENGSGVCVQPDGTIITAAHLIIVKPPEGRWVKRGTFTLPPVVPIRFPGGETQSARVLGLWYRDKQSDLAVLKVEGDGYPFLKLAAASPGIGKPVTSIGYPAGHFARMESDVTWMGETKDKSLKCLVTSHRVNPGNSGGPLLNAQGEVCGILAKTTFDAIDRGKLVKTEQLSCWSRVEEVRAALANFAIAGMTDAGTPRPTKRSALTVLEVWGEINCPPCLHAHGAYEAGLLTVDGKPIDQVFAIEFHDVKAEHQRAVALGIKSLPAYRLPSTGEILYGYTGPEELDYKLSAFVSAPVYNPPAQKPKALSEPRVVVSQDVVPAPEPTAPIATAPPAATVTPSWPATVPLGPAPDESQVSSADDDGIRVVFIVRKQDYGKLAGDSLTLVEQFIETGLCAKLNGVLGEKAEVECCFERLRPKRFEAVATSVGLEPATQFRFLVFVKKRFTGIVGEVVGKIERVIKPLADSTLKKAGIETIIERTDEAYFDQVAAALDVAEPETKVAEKKPTTAETLPEGDNWLYSILATLGGLFTGARDTLLARKGKVGVV